MYIEKLVLEVTRCCTLACEHCLRGDAQNANVSLETLENIFQDITEIDTLLITGGEPLVAVNQLEKLIELVKQKKIKINNIMLISNGTVLSSRVLKILKELHKISKVKFAISADLFHIIELERRGLLEKRNENFSIFKELFDAYEYGKDDENHYDSLLMCTGRAKYLTQERLDEIYAIYKKRYRIIEWIKEEQPATEISDDKLTGLISFDINGNLVHYGLSFEEEDKEALETNININKMSLREATNIFVDNLKKELELKYSKFNISLKIS